jgi:hypothetical protein
MFDFIGVCLTGWLSDLNIGFMASRLLATDEGKQVTEKGRSIPVPICLQE